MIAKLWTGIALPLGVGAKATRYRLSPVSNTEIVGDTGKACRAARAIAHVPSIVVAGVVVVRQRAIRVVAIVCALNR